MRRKSSPVLAGCLVLLVGCGPTEYTLSGHIRTPAGEPIGYGQVIVENRAKTFGSASYLKPDGAFAIPGLPADEYVIYLADTRIPADSSGERHPDDPKPGRQVHKRYENPATSGLTATLPGSGDVELIVDQP